MSDWDLKELLILLGLSNSEGIKFVHSMRLSGAGHVHISGKVYSQEKLKEIEDNLTIDNNIEQALNIV